MSTYGRPPKVRGGGGEPKLTESEAKEYRGGREPVMVSEERAACSISSA